MASLGAELGWLCTCIAGFGSSTPYPRTGACISAGIQAHALLLLLLCCRSSNASPLFVADTQLILPEPEWSLLAQVARGDDSFAMQLQGRLDQLGCCLQLQLGCMPDLHKKTACVVVVRTWHRHTAVPFETTAILLVSATVMLPILARFATRVTAWSSPCCASQVLSVSLLLV